MTRSHEKISETLSDYRLMIHYRQWAIIWGTLAAAESIVILALVLAR